MPGQRGRERHQVRHVVDHVRADRDVAHRDLVGEVGPHPVVRREADPAVPGSGLQGPQHRGLGVDGVQVAAGRDDRRGWPHRRRRPRRARGRRAAGRPGRARPAARGSVLPGREHLRREAVGRLRRGGEDLRVDRPGGELVGPLLTAAGRSAGPQVLECLAAGETAELVAVDVDEGAHPVRVGAGVLPERPADRLAQEEVTVVEVGLDGHRRAGGRRSGPWRPTWQITAVRRSHRSSSVAQAARSGGPRPGCASSSGPTRWVATSSTRSHQAPVTSRCRYSGRTSGSRCPAYRRSSRRAPARRTAPRDGRRSSQSASTVACQVARSGSAWVASTSRMITRQPGAVDAVERQGGLHVGLHLRAFWRRRPPSAGAGRRSPEPGPQRRSARRRG